LLFQGRTISSINDISDYKYAKLKEEDSEEYRAEMVANEEEINREGIYSIL